MRQSARLIILMVAVWTLSLSVTLSTNTARINADLAHEQELYQQFNATLEKTEAMITEMQSANRKLLISLCKDMPQTVGCLFSAIN